MRGVGVIKPVRLRGCDSASWWKRAGGGGLCGFQSCTVKIARSRLIRPRQRCSIRLPRAIAYTSHEKAGRRSGREDLANHRFRAGTTFPGVEVLRRGRDDHGLVLEIITPLRWLDAGVFIPDLVCCLCCKGYVCARGFHQCISPTAAWGSCGWSQRALWQLGIELRRGSQKSCM